MRSWIGRSSVASGGWALLGVLACASGAAGQARSETNAWNAEAAPSPVASANGPLAISLEDPAAEAADPVEPAPADRARVVAEPWSSPASTSEKQSLGEPGAVATHDAEEALPVPVAASEGSFTDRLLRMLDPRESEIARVGGALAVVIGLLLLARMIFRRTGMPGAAGRPSGVLEILARYPIGRGQQLILLKLARRIVLVHASGSSMQTLCEVQDQDEVAGLLSRIEAGSRGGDAKRFREMLTQFEHEHDRLPPPRDRDARRARTFNVSSADGEVIDLTRRRNALFSTGMLSRRAAQ